MACMYAAWRVWFVTEFKPRNKMALTEEDNEFMRTVLEGYKPGGGKRG